MMDVFPVSGFDSSICEGTGQTRNDGKCRDCGAEGPQYGALMELSCEFIARFPVV